VYEAAQPALHRNDTLVVDVDRSISLQVRDLE
jgi:hypothetical protein